MSIRNVEVSRRELVNLRHWVHDGHTYGAIARQFGWTVLQTYKLIQRLKEEGKL